MAERFTLRTMLEFCAEEPSRKLDLTSPFQIGKWLYATNGHVAIRLPFNGREPKLPIAMADGDLWRVPAMEEQVWWKHDSIPAGEWQDWPSAVYEFDDRTECELCGGAGVIFQSNSDPDCDLHQLTRKNCLPCNGSGVCYGPNHILLGPAGVAIRYDKLIRKLKNVQFSPPSDAKSIILFIFDQGGQGVVMPLNLDRH